jgi:multidrug resistance efflux pump
VCSTSACRYLEHERAVAVLASRYHDRATCRAVITAWQAAVEQHRAAVQALAARAIQRRRWLAWRLHVSRVKRAKALVLALGAAEASLGVREALVSWRGWVEYESYLRKAEGLAEEHARAVRLTRGLTRMEDLRLALRVTLQPVVGGVRGLGLLMLVVCV